ncbi:acylphosphatase [Phytoactinopolyspora limicola]|uniref:acylphosphatase n=1 Tax=Phytoactinopolyspora limicola TaxID=2715536 RepID=UPI001409158D|nr:acylphosphatase [Phytoactinopolyspora limicola]
MRINEVLLAEVAGAGDPGPRSTRPDRLSVVVYVRADDASEQVVIGGGVTTLPPGTQSPWNSPTLAAAMMSAAGELGGVALGGADPLREVSDLVAGFARHAHAAARTSRQHVAVDCVRGALEVALLEAVARARGTRLAGLLGVRRARPRPSASTIPAGADVEAIRAEVAAQHSQYPVTRLAAHGNVERDVQALLVADEVNNTGGAPRPLWLECSGRYSAPHAENLVAELATLRTKGRLGAPVYVEQPIPRSRRRELAALLAQARDLGASGGRGGELRIVLDESVETETDLHSFLHDGPVQAVSVGLRRGIGTALRIAEAAVAADPDTMVIVAGSGHPSDVEAAGLDELAQVVPKLDMFLPGQATVRLARYGEDDVDRGWAVDPAPSGLGAEPSLPRIVGAMGRAIQVKVAAKADPWGGAAGHNRFDTPGLETLGKNSLDSYLLEREARRLGLTTMRFHAVDFHASDASGRSIGFHCTTGPSTSRFVAKVCARKDVSRAYLTRAGVAVPAGRLMPVADWPRIEAFARALGWPVVVKPPDGKGGRGVTSNIADESTLRRAVSELAAAGLEAVIIEEHIPGSDYRFFVVGDDVVSVLSRRPGHVVGDGRSTVAELILAKNLVRLRNPHLRSRLLTLDAATVQRLRRQDTYPDSVPPAGQYVALTTAGNVSLGGESAEVLDETDPSLLDLAVRAVRAVPGLGHAGVDILAADHRLALSEQRAGVCELNSLPATSAHHFPASGPVRNVSRALMDHYTARHGLSTVAQSEQVAVRLRVTGQVQAVGYRQWLANLAHELGLSGWVRNAAEPDVVEAAVAGPLDLVSAVAMQAIFGPSQARPELVETTVSTERLGVGFTIRERQL